MPAFLREGVELHYELVGTGPTVVLHTGGAGSGRMWRDGGYVERLAGFRLILFDHRGRGRSSRPSGVEAHRLEEYVADVLALADAIGVERYGFVGYSFGGLVGLAVAAADPRVEGLVALSCAFDPPRRQPGTEDDAGYAQVADMRELVEVIEHGEQIELPRWLRDDFLATDADQFRLTLEASAGVPDPWHLLPRIVSPAMLIAGSEEDPDRTLPPMAEQMADARSVHLPGCGHVGAFMRPDEVTAAARTVLHD